MDSNPFFQDNQIIYSKEQYILLENCYDSNFFTFSIQYPIGAELFSGKTCLTNTIQQDGVDFTFSDSENAGNEYFGPIIGILYSNDHNYLLS